MVNDNMENEDYEALPGNITILSHMSAGAAAGIMEHSIMYPIDCVKTRMQCLVPDPKANYRNVFHALNRIIHYEGIKNTVRGLNAVIIGAGPAHALYFACYEKMKTILSGSQQGNHLANALAGGFATVLHDALMNPTDVVKQRMQMYNSPYKTCVECCVTIAQTEGIRAFYRSFFTQLSMNIPFQSLHFVVYEYCQDKLNHDRSYNPQSHIISGALAGAIAAAATTPLDVCKTLLNTQETCAVSKGGAISGIVQAFKTVYQFRGYMGFFRGVSARVIFQMPSTAISWTVYEFFKYFLKKQGQNADCDTGLIRHCQVKKSVQVHAVTRDQ